jgi:DNA-binding NarL/FixJ family response regulator
VLGAEVDEAAPEVDDASVVGAGAGATDVEVVSVLGAEVDEAAPEVDDASVVGAGAGATDVEVASVLGVDVAPLASDDGAVLVTVPVRAVVKGVVGSLTASSPSLDHARCGLVLINTSLDGEKNRVTRGFDRLFETRSLGKPSERGIANGGSWVSGMSRMGEGGLEPALGHGRPVLLADGDEEARTALAALLDNAGFDVIEATTGEDALAVARQLVPSAVILEIPLGDLSGYEVCRALREELGDELPILFVSGTRTESYDRVVGLIVGADDYMVKPYAPDELLARVRRLVHRSRLTVARAASRLTPRELEVLELLADGRSPQEISAGLFISAKTVSTHIEHIFTKLGVNSRSQAVALAYRDGLVTTGAEASTLPASRAASRSASSPLDARA